MPKNALRQVSQRTISTASRRQLENRVSEGQKLFQHQPYVCSPRGCDFSGVNCVGTMCC
uniref:Uncharacterized protein n=1 Tax=Ficedula albicollis TaxID=59894 RepID=A0A803V6U9_FICAL